MQYHCFSTPNECTSFRNGWVPRKTFCPRLPQWKRHEWNTLPVSIAIISQGFWFIRIWGRKIDSEVSYITITKAKETGRCFFSFFHSSQNSYGEETASVGKLEVHLKPVFIIPNPSTLSFPTCSSNQLLCCNIRNDAGSTKIKLSLILPHLCCQFYLFCLYVCMAFFYLYWECKSSPVGSVQYLISRFPTATYLYKHSPQAEHKQPPPDVCLWSKWDSETPSSFIKLSWLTAIGRSILSCQILFLKGI